MAAPGTDGVRWRRMMLPGCAVGAPVVAAAGILGRFVANLPIQDDYRAIIEFALRFRGMPTVGGRMVYLIADQHTDYKLIFEHGLVALELLLTRHLNFALLMVLGNLFLLPLAVLVWKACFREERDLRVRMLLFVPAAWVLFSLNYAETLDWAMAGLQNLPVIVFSLGAIYLLVESWGREAEDWWFGAACAAGVLACLSSANGFLLGPVGAAALAARRRYGRAAVWAASFGPAAAAYGFRYHTALPAMKVAAWVKPVFFLSVAGAAAPLPFFAPAGLLLVVVWVGAWRRGYCRENAYAGLVVAWVFATCALITVGRGNYGLAGANVPRYRIYSDLLLVLSYAYGVERVRRAGVAAKVRRRMYAGAVVGSMVFCGCADVWAWRYLSVRARDVRVGLERYRADPAVNSPMYTSDAVVAKRQEEEAEVSRRLMGEVEASGLYQAR